MTKEMFTFLISEGLAEIDNGRVRLTPYGYGTLLHLRYRASKRTT